VKLQVRVPKKLDGRKGSDLSLAKTSSATKHGAILGSESLNTISIALTDHGDFGRRDPHARATQVIYKDGRKVGPDEARRGFIGLLFVSSHLRM